jgi:hypothetical protein
VAQAQVALHRLAPQVEHAVLEAHALGQVFLVQLERQRRGLVEDLDLLDLASTSPLASFGFTVPSSRRWTVPVTLSTNWFRTCSAILKTSVRCGRQTTCASPSRSCRSMKITPPWSRGRLAKPHSVTLWPM